MIEAITFAAEPAKLYVPLNEAARHLNWQLPRIAEGEGVSLNGVWIPAQAMRYLLDQTKLVTVGDLTKAGAQVEMVAYDGMTNTPGGEGVVAVSVAPQRVEINLAHQQLRAWQGSRLVLQSRISSGRNDATPPGDFTAGPYRSRMHYSKRYHHAPMPWSVQINGHIFVHGFTSVPDYPASHGCIRLPLDEGNPAKFFFEWVMTGTPVHVVRQ